MTIEPLTPERRRQQTRQYLLEAAARVFEARGFYGASLDEVASAAGFTKGAVYSNFDGKDDLFLALLEQRYNEDVAALRATLEASDVPPEDRLSDFVALLRGERGRGAWERWGLLYQEFCLYALRHPTAREKLVEFDQQMARAIASAIETGHMRRGAEPAAPAVRLARVVLAFNRGIGMMQALEPEAIDDELLETAVSFIARALGT